MRHGDLPATLERMSQDQPSLLQLARAGFDDAKRLDRAKSWMRRLLLVVGLVALLFDGLAAYILTIVAVVSEIISWWLGHSSLARHALAEEAKRRAMFADAFGERVEPGDILELRSRFPDAVTRSALRAENDYYSSKETVGPIRLRDHLEESAFWSWHLYLRAARRAMFRSMTFLALALVAALLALPVASDTAGLLFARVLLVALGAVVAAGSLGASLRWRAAGARCQQVLSQIRTIEIADTEPCLALVSDYSVAVAIADPIPSGLYHSQRVRLNELWRHHLDQR